jgi:hypothetical protein
MIKTFYIYFFIAVTIFANSENTNDFTKNLLINADAESGVVSWDNNTNLKTVGYGKYWVADDLKNKFEKGDKAFAGFGGDVDASQNIDISSLSATKFLLSGITGGYDAQDSAQLHLVFKDINSEILSTFSTKKFSSQKSNGLFEFELIGDIPQKAVSVTVKIDMRLNAGRYADQIIDNLNLQLFNFIDSSKKTESKVQKDIKEEIVDYYDIDPKETHFGKEKVITTKSDKQDENQIANETKRVQEFVQEVSVETPVANKKNVVAFEEDKIKGIDILKNIVFSFDPSLIKKDRDLKVDKKYDLDVKELQSNGSLDVINKLQDSKINMGVARGDILGIKNNALYGFEQFQNYGILCSSGSSLLYIVSKKEIKSVYDLMGAIVSTGKISNISQIYLNDIIKNSGLNLDINFESLDMKDSLKALKKGSIDAIFMFESKEYIYDLLKSGFKISSMPKDMSDLLKKEKGLIEYKYKIDNRLILTYKVPNYIIAPLETLDTQIGKKIEAVVDKFECYKNIQNIDPFYGKIHPNVKDAIANIINKNGSLSDDKGGISISFEKIKKVDDKKTYYYSINNTSSKDINVSFDYYKTEIFDTTSIKPRHVLSNFPQGVIEVKSDSKRMISFIYENRFSIKVEDAKVEGVFKDLINKDKRYTATINIGDE